jgi:hypothetical protein
VIQLAAMRSHSSGYIGRCAMLPDPRDVPFLTPKQARDAMQPHGPGERAIRDAVRRGAHPAGHVGGIRIPTAALWELAGLTLPGTVDA